MEKCAFKSITMNGASTGTTGVPLPTYILINFIRAVYQCPLFPIK